MLLADPHSQLLSHNFYYFSLSLVLVPFEHFLISGVSYMHSISIVQGLEGVVSCMLN